MSGFSVSVSLHKSAKKDLKYDDHDKPDLIFEKFKPPYPSIH